MKSVSKLIYASRIAPSDYKSQVALLNVLNDSEKEVLDLILIFNNNYKTIWVGQEFIGKQVGLCRVQVNRIIQKLFRFGLILKRRRFNNTCLYKIPIFLHNPQIRYEFKDIFSAFKTFSLIMLFSSIFTGMARSDVTLTEMDIRNTSSSHISFISIPPSIIETQYVNNLRKCISKNWSTAKMYVTEEQKKAIMEATRILGLSKVGQIKLTAYPSEAIEYTLGKLKFTTTNNLKNVFSFFLSVCKEWCKQNSMPEDQQTVRTLLEKYKLDWYASPTFDGGMDGKVAREGKGIQKRETSRPVTAWSKPGKQQFKPRWQAEADIQLKAGQITEDEYAVVEKDNAISVDDPRFLQAAMKTRHLLTPESEAELFEKHGNNPVYAPLLALLKNSPLAKNDAVVISKTPSFEDGQPIIDYAAYDDGENNNQDDIEQTI